MRLIPFFLLILLLPACQPDRATPDEDYVFKVPEHFPSPAYNLERNPVTESGFKLGKKLFNELRLSRDNSVSCASCHQQSVAFADPQHRLSLGVDERVGVRNAPGLFNLAFTREFMWDGGIAHLDFVPINAINSAFEMDETLTGVVEKLLTDSGYRNDFKNAFGQDTITAGLMLQALSQYQLMLVSDRSKYDDVLLGRNGAAFTPAEERGALFFNASCSSCHAGVLFTDKSYRNNGLDSEDMLDAGRSLITETETDRGKFRVPTLRNVARTGPYMHDGRLPSLEVVLEHYRSGIRTSASLNPGLVGGIPMSDREMADVIAFLETLTDWELISDQRF